MGLTIVARSTVAILDYRVLVRRGLEAIVADSGRHEVQFVASSAAELFSILQECRQTGEMLPDVSASVITGALEALPNNRHFVGPVMVGHLIRAFVAEQRQPGNVLTEREQDVLRLAAQRLSNREIAKSLSITEHTVKTHLRHASEKLGAKTRHEAVSFAVETGMILEPRLTPLTKQASRKHNSSQVPADDVPPERA